MKKETHFGKIARLPDKAPDKSAPEMVTKDRTSDTEREPNVPSLIKLSLPKSLHSQLIGLAAEEGISLSEYIIFKLTQYSEQEKCNSRREK